MRTITRRKVLLFLLLLIGAVVYATTAGANSPHNHKPTKAERDTPAVMKDIRDGKAQKVTPPGRGKHTSGVWTGCRFVYLTTDVNDYRFDDGSMASVSENPEALPPKDPGCVERNPTEQEMNEMRSVTNARNAGNRPPGAENRPLPPEPRSRHLDDKP